MATQNASASITASQNLVIWGSDQAGLTSLDSVDFYTWRLQPMFSAMLINKDGFSDVNASWDLGLLDQNGNELSGGGYTRTNINFSQGNWVPATQLNTVQNGITISWNAAGTAYQIGFYDHATGKLLQAAPLSSPVNAASGDTVQFAVGSLSLYVHP
jgi:hypothetical protein